MRDGVSTDHSKGMRVGERLGFGIRGRVFSLCWRPIEMSGC
jgi:hypothetical protein